MVKKNNQLNMINIWLDYHLTLVKYLKLIINKNWRGVYSLYISILAYIFNELFWSPDTGKGNKPKKGGFGFVLETELTNIGVRVSVTM